MSLLTSLPTDGEIHVTLAKYEKTKLGVLDNANSLLPDLVHKAGRSDIANHLDKLLGTDGPLTAAWELRNPASAALVARHLVEADEGKVPNAVLGSKPFVSVSGWQDAFYNDQPSSYPFNANATRLIWSRRVAVALLADFQGLWPWKLAQYPRWVNGVMLDLRRLAPGGFIGLSDVYSGFGSSQDFYAVTASSWSTGRLFESNEPFLAQAEAKKIFDKAGPKNPREACYAVSEWMVRKRFVHGYAAWYLHCAGTPAPPSSVFNPGPGLAASPCTLRQAIDFKWGGCPVNSAYVARVLNGMNVPTVVVLEVAAAHAPSESDSEKIFSYSGFGDPGHTSVYAVGAGLAMIHGDDALADAGQVSVLPPPKSMWRPAGATWWAHRMLAVPKPGDGAYSSVDDKTLMAVGGKSFLAELRDAAKKMPERPELSFFGHPAWNALEKVTPKDRAAFGDALDLLAFGCGIPPSLYWLASDEPWADQVSWGDTPRNRPVPLTEWYVAKAKGSAAPKPAFKPLPGISGVPSTIPEPELGEYLARHGRIALQGQGQRPGDAAFRLRHVVLTGLLPPTVVDLTPAAKLDAQVLNSWAVKVVVQALRLKGETLGTDGFQARLDELRAEARKMFALKPFADSAFPNDRLLMFKGNAPEPNKTEKLDPLTRGDYFYPQRRRRCHPGQERVRECDTLLGVPSVVRFAVRAVLWYLQQKQPEAW
jgi:hypothetical protein